MKAGKYFFALMGSIMSASCVKYIYGDLAANEAIIIAAVLYCVCAAAMGLYDYYEYRRSAQAAQKLQTDDERYISEIKSCFDDLSGKHENDFKTITAALSEFEAAANDFFAAQSKNAEENRGKLDNLCNMLSVVSAAAVNSENDMKKLASIEGNVSEIKDKCTETIDKIESAAADIGGKVCESGEKIVSENNKAIEDLKTLYNEKADKTRELLCGLGVILETLSNIVCDCESDIKKLSAIEENVSEIKDKCSETSDKIGSAANGIAEEIRESCKDIISKGEEAKILYNEKADKACELLYSLSGMLEIVSNIVCDCESDIKKLSAIEGNVSEIKDKCSKTSDKMESLPAIEKNISDIKDKCAETVNKIESAAADIAGKVAESGEKIISENSKAAEDLKTLYNEKTEEASRLLRGLGGALEAVSRIVSDCESDINKLSAIEENVFDINNKCSEITDKIGSAADDVKEEVSESCKEIMSKGEDTIKSAEAIVGKHEKLLRQLNDIMVRLSQDEFKVIEGLKTAYRLLETNRRIK